MVRKLLNQPEKPTGTFLGYKMSQTPKSVWLWERVLRSFPFKRIIDLGTWHGGLSLYFYLFCLEREAEFYTFDVRNKCFGNRLMEITNFYNHFELLDIFQNIEKIGSLITKQGLTILFCDNGNKPREFNTFAPYLKKDDIIAVHDWLTEIFPENIKDACEKYNLQEIFSKECEEEGMTRFFQKWK